MTRGIVAFVGSSAPAVPMISTFCAMPAEAAMRVRTLSEIGDAG